MRLMELVQCGFRAMSADDTMPEAETEAAAPLDPRAMLANRRRRAARASPSAALWRPSLAAISEQGSSSATPAVSKTAVSRDGKSTSGRSRKAKAGASHRLLPRSHSDSYQHVEVSSVVPSFTPTAFLF